MPPTNWLRGCMDPSHTCEVTLRQDHTLLVLRERPDSRVRERSVVRVFEFSTLILLITCHGAQASQLFSLAKTHAPAPSDSFRLLAGQRANSALCPNLRNAAGPRASWPRPGPLGAARSCRVSWGRGAVTASESIAFGLDSPPGVSPDSTYPCCRCVWEPCQTLIANTSFVYYII